MDMTMSSATPTRVEVVTSVQRLFRGRVGVTKELPKQVNAQHHLCGKG